MFGELAFGLTHRLVVGVDPRGGRVTAFGAGSAPGAASINKDGVRVFDDGGYTEVHWDSSETQGIECRNCGWQHQPFDLDVLTAISDDEEDDS